MGGLCSFRGHPAACGDHRAGGLSSTAEDFAGFPGVLLPRWPLRACCYRRGSADAARSRATDPATAKAAPAAVLGLRRCTARATRRTPNTAAGASLAIASTVSRRGWRRPDRTPMTIPTTEKATSYRAQPRSLAGRECLRPGGSRSLGAKLAQQVPLLPPDTFHLGPGRRFRAKAPRHQPRASSACPRRQGPLPALGGPVPGPDSSLGNNRRDRGHPSGRPRGPGPVQKEHQGCPERGADCVRVDRRAVGVQFWLAVLRLACIQVAARSCQPQFGLIEEDVNLLLVVSGPQAGGRELLVPNLIWSHRWSPYSEERVANSCEEDVNLLLVIAGPQAGRREFTRLDPLGQHGSANFRVGRRPWGPVPRPWGPVPRAGVRGQAHLGRRVCCQGQLMDDRGPAPDAELSVSSLCPALQASDLQQPGRSRGQCQLTRHEPCGLSSIGLRKLGTTPS